MFQTLLLFPNWLKQLLKLNFSSIFLSTIYSIAIKVHTAGHSVETKLLDAYSSILLANDSGKSYFLVLLDLSVAFDTIFHSRLLSILESSFGITGQALSWINSYLTGRSFKIKARSLFWSVKHSDIGLPQGRVLVPLFFNWLPSILANMGVQCHLYADGTQFLITFDIDEESSAREKVLMAF